LAELASRDLDDFLAQLCYPVLLTGPFASAQLDDPTFTEEQTLGSMAESGQGMVVPLRARSKAKLSAGELFLGRGMGCDVLLPFATVSRVHAKVTRRADGQVVIADGGSRNGTWVNGRKAEAGEELRLDDDSVIKLGSLEVRFLLPETLYWYFQVRPKDERT
jgi:pSer/pThr/pTyr-binding forkhead associated (FHA) protein